MDNAVKRFRQIFGCYTNTQYEKLNSSICRPTDFERLPSWEPLKLCGVYPGSGDIIEKTPDNMYAGSYTPCRKIWEWLFICQALSERNMLTPMTRGLGFAVGMEPLPSIFACFGCDIVATDAPPHIASDWELTKQRGKAADDLLYPFIVDSEQFFKRVEFKYVDMKNIPSQHEKFDFLWSSCALEHLGSLYASKDFIYSAMDCLKPGGVAVHTSEINLKSSVETLMMGANCILRTVDFIEIAEHLEWQGHLVEPLDFRLDGSPLDEMVDAPPYSLPHFKLKLDRYITTSFGLIIQKSKEEDL